MVSGEPCREMLSSDLYHIIPLILVHNSLLGVIRSQSLSPCGPVVKTLVAKIQRSWVQIPPRAKVKKFSNFNYFQNFKRNFNFKIKRKLKLIN